MTEKAEVSIGGGATIKGNVAAPAEQVAIGQANTQIEAGQDVLQQQFDQRQDTRTLDQSRDDRRYNQSRDQRRYDQAYDTVGGSNYNFQNPDNARVWEAIVELTKTMDNLPARMATVEAIVLPIPAPLMTAVPIALNLPGKQSVTAIVPAEAIVKEPKLPTWVMIALIAMGIVMFLLIVVGAVLAGIYLF